MSPKSQSRFFSVWYVYYEGNLNSSAGDSGANASQGVRPVVYLTSDISLSGTGTGSDPFTIN